VKNEEIEAHQIEMQDKFNKMLLDYGKPTENYKIVAVGYLSIDEDFEKGEVPKTFLTKLKILWNQSFTLYTLGHHDCEFCIDEGNYKNRAQSSSSKDLTDKENNIKYYFPEMIFHYIKVHKFKPSNDFIEFVMRI